MRRVGLTTYGRNEKNQFYLPSEYVDAIRRAGAVPILLPPGEQDLDAWLACVDGVVLTGGGDIEPHHYEGELHDSMYRTDPERDHTELDLAKILLDRQIPTLAICRGIQVLNVVLGGTLLTHIPDKYGEVVLHRHEQLVPSKHIVNVDPNSRLAQIFPTLSFEIASLHHQAVLQCPDVVKSVAYAEDGVVEAIEIDGQPNVIAVQWHPEMTAAQDPLQQGLFNYFVQLTQGETS